jgi:hypothetical protein
MRSQRLVRGLSSLLLALAAAEASAGAAKAAFARAPHACEEHVCFCRKPAAASPAAPCHGEADEDAPRLTAACDHDAASATLAATRPAVRPRPVAAFPTGGSRPLPRASAAPAKDGFRLIESPPPRTARIAPR